MGTPRAVVTSRLQSECAATTFWLDTRPLSEYEAFKRERVSQQQQQQRQQQQLEMSTVVAAPRFLDLLLLLFQAAPTVRVKSEHACFANLHPGSGACESTYGSRDRGASRTYIRVENFSSLDLRQVRCRARVCACVIIKIIIKARTNKCCYTCTRVGVNKRSDEWGAMAVERTGVPSICVYMHTHSV